MKLRSLIIAVFTGSALVAAGMNEYPSENEARPWKLVEETGKITLYERWVEVNEDLEVRERKGIFTVNCPAEEAIKFICNADMAPSWMKGVSESYVIETLSETAWYTYTLYHIPWPFDNRDLVTQYRVVKDGKGSTFIYLDSKEGVMPENEKVERLKTFHACWEVEEISPASTRITFTARTDEGPAFPRWIQDPIVKKAFISNLENLKELLNTQLVLAN